MSRFGGALRRSDGVRRRRLLGLAALVLLVALAGCESAPPHPQVCHGCSDSGAVHALPSDAAVGASTTHLYVGREGAPRVVARTELDPKTAAELRRNESLRRAVEATVLDVRDGGEPPSGGATAPGTASPYYYGPEGRRGYAVPAFAARDLSVGVDDAERLVVEFRVTGVPDEDPEDPAPPLARRGVGGAVLVDRFDVRDGRNPHPGNTEPFPYRIETGRLVVHGPPGTRPVVVPDGARVEGNAVVLTDLPADSNVVFAPPGTTGTVAAHATLTADRLGWMVPDALWTALVPLLQFGVLLGGLRAGASGGTRYAVAGALLALLVTVAPLAILLGTVGVVVVGVVLLVAGILYVRARRGDGAEEAGESAGGSRLRPDADRLRARAAPWARPLGVTLAGAALVAVLAAATDGGGVGLLSLLAGLVLPLVGFAGLGTARPPDQHAQRRRWLVLTVLVAPWLAALGYVAGRGIPDTILAVFLVLGYGTVGVVAGFVLHGLASAAAARTVAD